MTPIEQAVAPLREDAIERAEVDAKAYVDRVFRDLEEAGWDLNKAAPYPFRFGTATLTHSYHIERSRRENFARLTEADPKLDYQRSDHDQPYMVVRSEKGVERFIDERRTLAAEQYDAFVAKLNAKIGPVKSASLEGNHVWDESVLTVETEAGETQRWRTKQIVNTSKLGKYFNQWPTRKLK